LKSPLHLEGMYADARMCNACSHSQIVLEMRKSSMLDLQQQAVSTTLATTRGLMGGINTAREHNVSVQKRIKLLENRLEKAYVKFNQSITQTKALREAINNLRRERLMFESIHINLERELAKLKRDMADTIQLAAQVRECGGSTFKGRVYAYVWFGKHWACGMSHV
jgi:chromosome segregation ATPase